MSERTPFLTARWEDLLLLTYRIPAAFLTSYLPRGLEPDRLPGDDSQTAYVSLVAFRFLDTRVKGLSIPGHGDFPEVNLRVYVRPTATPERRGVLFIAELVPKPAITMVANVLYHEPYRTLPMRASAVDVEGDVRRLTMEIDAGGRTHTIVGEGLRPPIEPASDSVEHFFKEHSFGYGRTADGDMVTYQVDHPVWRVYPCDASDIALDLSFEELYGSPWGALDGAAPAHVAFAEGSAVSLFPRDD